MHPRKNSFSKQPLKKPRVEKVDGKDCVCLAYHSVPSSERYIGRWSVVLAWPCQIDSDLGISRKNYYGVIFLCIDRQAVSRQFHPSNHRAQASMVLGFV